MRKVLLSVVAVLLLSLPLAGCGLTQDFQSVQDLAGKFMTALQESDYQAAFRLFGKDLQDEVGSADNLGAMAQNNGVVPKTWNFTNTSISTDNGQTIGTVEGTVDYEDGGSGDLQIHMLKVEAATTVWIIVGFNLTR
jgi:hypothetical protein